MPHFATSSSFITGPWGVAGGSVDNSAPSTFFGGRCAGGALSWLCHDKSGWICHICHDILLLINLYKSEYYESMMEPYISGLSIRVDSKSGPGEPMVYLAGHLAMQGVPKDRRAKGRGTDRSRLAPAPRRSCLAERKQGETNEKPISIASQSFSTLRKL